MTLTQQRGPQQRQGVVQAGFPRPALRRYLPLYGRLQLRVLGAGQELEAEQHSVHARLRARPVQVTLASVRSREVTVRSPEVTWKKYICLLDRQPGWPCLRCISCR